MFLDADNVAVGPTNLPGVLESLSQSINFMKQQVMGVHVFSIARNNNSFVPDQWAKIICTETFNNGVTEGLKFDPETSQFYVRGDVSRLIIINQLELYFQGSSMPNTTFPVSPRVYIRPYYYNRSNPDTEVSYSSHTMNFTFPGLANNDTAHVLGYNVWTPSYENLKFEQRINISRGPLDPVSVTPNNSSSKIIILTLWNGAQA